MSHKNILESFHTFLVGIDERIQDLEERLSRFMSLTNTSLDQLVSQLTAAEAAMKIREQGLEATLNASITSLQAQIANLTNNDTDPAAIAAINAVIADLQTIAVTAPTVTNPPASNPPASNPPASNPPASTSVTSAPVTGSTGTVVPNTDDAGTSTDGSASSQNASNGSAVSIPASQVPNPSLQPATDSNSEVASSAATNNPAHASTVAAAGALGTISYVNGVAVSVDGKALYKFTGTDPTTIDASAWTPIQVQVTPTDIETYYTFTGDTNNGVATGASTEWVVVTAPQ